MPECPDKCSGRSLTRQHLLTGSQFEMLSEAAKQEVNKPKSQVYRCNYCGCVYIDEISSTRELGDFDGGVTGERWKSSKYA
jgi:hypothetical protein